MDLRQTLHELGIRPDRDQHFLEDDETLDFEIELAKLNKNDVALEIGAGPGNLTEKIAARAGVIAVESDKRFLQLLESRRKS
jgi:16S rRNA (adenine1518-N6/adenine1519-N6)-dimethyltransferase